MLRQRARLMNATRPQFDSNSEKEDVVQCNAFYSGFRRKQALCNGTRMAIEK